MKLKGTVATLPGQGELALLGEGRPLPKVWKGLYAALPGTGPKGETCGSCRHLYRRRYSKVYLKCALCEPKWTGGPGSDIKARAPACSKWEKREERKGDD